jgi:hypothetical protein
MPLGLNKAEGLLISTRSDKELRFIETGTPGNDDDMIPE